MLKREWILGLLGAAALSIPLAAHAQQYGGQERPYEGGQPGYGQPPGYGPQGDYYGEHRRDWWGRGFNGYPEFRGEEDHIRREIWQAVREDMIDQGDARELMDHLRDIQRQEAWEFRAHGWNLPDDDRARIRERLNYLDRQVDRIRQEP